MGCGTSKSGRPMLRLTGFLILRARSNIRRIPDDSMYCIRSAIQRFVCDILQAPEVKTSSYQVSPVPGEPSGVSRRVWEIQLILELTAGRGRIQRMPSPGGRGALTMNTFVLDDERV